MYRETVLLDIIWRKRRAARCLVGDGTSAQLPASAHSFGFFLFAAVCRCGGRCTLILTVLFITRRAARVDRAQQRAALAASAQRRT